MEWIRSVLGFVSNGNTCFSVQGLGFRFEGLGFRV